VDSEAAQLRVVDGLVPAEGSGVHAKFSLPFWFTKSRICWRKRATLPSTVSAHSGPHRFRKDGYVFLGESPSKKSVARDRAGLITRPQCIAALDAAVAGVIPTLKPEN
jgi:hypothetical protein